MKFDQFITFLGTEDLTNTSNFYHNLLGLDLYKDQGLCKIFSVTNESKIGFCSHMPVVYKDKSPILTFVLNNVDEYYERLVKAGVIILHPPQLNQKFRIYHFFFQDPNGYTLEVQKFLE